MQKIMKPQEHAHIIHDPAGSSIAIWTPDGRSVMMTPHLAREIARRILQITSTPPTEARKYQPQ